MKSRCRLSAVLFAFALTSPVLAEPTALGRLFLDPQQRALLDQQRLRNPGFLANTEEGNLTLNGEIKSSNGRKTRWINGTVDWTGTTPTPGVPVGDTLDRTTGERQSLISSGRITIHRAPAKP